LAENGKPSLKVIWRLLKQIKPYKWKALLLYGLLYAGLGVNLFRPVIVAWAVDHVTRMLRAGANGSRIAISSLCLNASARTCRARLQLRPKLTLGPG